MVLSLFRNVIAASMSSLTIPTASLRLGFFFFPYARKKSGAYCVSVYVKFWIDTNKFGGVEV